MIFCLSRGYKSLNPEKCDSNIFDFDGDLYGKEIRVELLKFLRKTVKMESLAEVKKQVDEDKAEALSFFKS